MKNTRGARVFNFFIIDLKKRNCVIVGAREGDLTVIKSPGNFVLTRLKKKLEKIRHRIRKLRLRAAQTSQK